VLWSVFGLVSASLCAVQSPDVFIGTLDTVDWFIPKWYAIVLRLSWFWANKTTCTDILNAKLFLTSPMLKVNENWCQYWLNFSTVTKKLFLSKFKNWAKTIFLLIFVHSGWKFYYSCRMIYVFPLFSVCITIFCFKVKLFKKTVKIQVMR
jgi:hypothetical protein